MQCTTLRLKGREFQGAAILGCAEPRQFMGFVKSRPKNWLRHTQAAYSDEAEAAALS